MTGPASLQAREADLEVIDRLAAAGPVIEAILCGRVIPNPDLLDALARLIGSASTWAGRVAA